jgi:hypothetical protein
LVVTRATEAHQTEVVQGNAQGNSTLAIRWHFDGQAIVAYTIQRSPVILYCLNYGMLVLKGLLAKTDALYRLQCDHGFLASLSSGESIVMV